MSPDIFGCHDWEGTVDILWVSEAAKPPTRRRIPPTTKNSPASDVDGLEVGKPVLVSS